MSAETEEKYLLAWVNGLYNTSEGMKIFIDSVRKKMFEMPTGGTAIMREGFNLIYSARKEQGLFVGKELRQDFKFDYRIYRLFPNGFCTFIHPFDGVYPEKVTPGRVAVGKVEYSIGKNPNPASLKFQDPEMKELVKT
jgi:photosystem I subunit 2